MTFDDAYGGILEKIGKNKEDVIGSRSCILSLYFDELLFHKLIYDEIKERISKKFN